MQFYGDYHTHTKNSDGHSTVEENVLAAKARGFLDVAITDHGLGCVIMKEKDFRKCFLEVEEARKKHPDINILFGIENTIIDADGLIDIPVERMEEFDIHIVGFHFPIRIPSGKAFREFWWPALLHGNSDKPSRELIERNTRAHIKMLEKYPVDILAHIGDHTPLDAKEVAKACADLGTYIELNSKHLPQCEKMFDAMLGTGVQFIADSDGHRAERVGEFSETEKLIEKFGLQDRVVNLRTNFYLRSKGREIIRPTVSGYKI
mgnify:FL=1